MLVPWRVCFVLSIEAPASACTNCDATRGTRGKAWFAAALPTFAGKANIHWRPSAATPRQQFDTQSMTHKTAIASMMNTQICEMISEDYICFTNFMP